MKWGITVANVSDFSKPPEKLSYPQQLGARALLRRGAAVPLRPTRRRAVHVCVAAAAADAPAR